VGLNVGIGTDGAASTMTWICSRENRLAAFIAKAVSNDPTVVSGGDCALHGNPSGARALHLGSVTGSLEPANGLT